MDIKDVQRYFLNAFASCVYPYGINWEELRKEIEMEDICERCDWSEVALDAPCYVCMKPANEECPYEGRNNDKSN